MYPSDDMLHNSIENEELYLYCKENEICAAVILNSLGNEGDTDVAWKVSCNHDEVLIPHALAVAKNRQGKGMGKMLMKEIISLGKAQGKNYCV